MRALLRTAMIATVVFAGAALLVGGPAIVADGLCYNAAAARLLNTGVYSYLSLDINTIQPPNAFVTPGYVWLLGLGYLFLPHSGDVVEVIVGAIPFIISLHFVAAVAAVVLIHATGRLIGGVRLGRIAGLAGALYLPFGAEAMSGWSENVSVFFAAAMVYLGVRLYKAEEHERLRRALALGLCAGAATLVRPVFALWILVPLGFFAWEHRRAWRRSAVPVLGGCLAIALVMAPWVIRNAVLFHRFIPLTEHAGTVMIDSVGGTAMTPDEDQAFSDAMRAGKDGYAEVALRRMRQQMEADTWKFTSGRLRDTVRMVVAPWSSQENPFNPYPPGTSRVYGEGYRLMSETAYSAWQSVIGILHGLFLVLALVGVVVMRKKPVVWLVAGLPLYLIAVCGVLGARARYFYPAMPGVILLAAIGIGYMLSAVRSRHS